MTNEFRLSENFLTDPSPHSVYIRLFEDDDPLSIIARYQDPIDFFRNKPNLLYYRLHLIKIIKGNNVAKQLAEHSMEKLAAGLMRLPLSCYDERDDCQLASAFDIPRPFDVSKDVWPDYGPALTVFENSEAFDMWCKVSPKVFHQKDKICRGQ